MASEEYSMKIVDSAVARLEKTGAYSAFNDKGCLERTSAMIAEQPINLAVESTLLTLKTEKELEKTSPKKIGMFTLHFSAKEVHNQDCPIQFEFRDPKGNVVATAGFFIQVGRPKEMHITSFQGGKNQKHLLKYLSKALGENWRVWAVKYLKAMAKSRKMAVVGVLPKQFDTVFGDDFFKWKRRIRQYKQTFRKAGIERIDSRFVIKPIIKLSKYYMAISNARRERRREERRAKMQKSGKFKRKRHP